MSRQNWQHTLRTVPELLLQVAEDLGIDPTDLHSAEESDPGDFHLQRQCSRTRVQTINVTKTAQLFTELASTCEDALTLELREGGLPVVTLADRQTLEELEDVKHRAEDPSYEISLDLRINKEKFFDDVTEKDDRAHFLTYFFPETLVNIFNLSLTELEEEKGPLIETVFRKRQRDDDSIRKLILLVAKPDLSLNGEHLAVVGGRYFNQLSSYVPEVCPGAKPLSEMRETAVTHLNWIDLSLHRLTPPDLQIGRFLPPDMDTAEEGVDQQALAIESGIYWRLLDICLLYTADRTRRTVAADRNKIGGPAPEAAADPAPEVDDWTSVFSTGDHQAKVRWGVQISKNLLSPEISSLAGFERFAKVVRRVYQAETLTADRLHNFQGVLASMLQGSPAAENYPSIARLAEEIDDNEKWSWQSFCDGKLSRYFGRLQELTALLDATNDRFREQIQALLKGVLDNTLAAIGVIVAFFVSSLLKPELSPDIVAYGILIYSAYVAIFPGLLGLLSARSQFESARKSLRNREFLFRQQLDEKAVDNKLVQEAEAAESRFWRWYWVVIMIYVMVILLLIAAADFLPSFLKALASP